MLHTDTPIDRGEIHITLAQLDDAADAIVGVVDGVETVEMARTLLVAWLEGAIAQLIADAPTYALNPQRGFARRAFDEALERLEAD